MKNKNLKILVTGHKGFIGNYLYKKLLELGYEVYGFDIVEGDDLLNFSKVEGIIKKVDIVYHIAAQADLNDMARDFDKAKSGLDINITATQNISLLCSKYNKWLIFASTLCVYGNIKKVADEDNILPNPSEIYACSKYASEWIIKGFNKSFGLEYTILRFATIYGVGMRPALGAQIFINQALKGDDVTVHGNGQQTRTLTYVEDLVDGCVRVLKNKDRALNQTINLSTSTPVSALRMAKDVQTIIKSKSNIVHIEQRKNQTLHERVSVSKAKELLKWETKTSWYLEIKKVIKSNAKEILS